MTQRPQYKFLRPYPPHNIGDLVPETYSKGMVNTMLAYNRIMRVAPEPVAVAPASEPVKALTKAPADKMLKVGNPKVHRKGVA